jgi:hypothetical protein
MIFCACAIPTMTKLQNLLLIYFDLMQMSIIPTDSSKVSSQRVFERKMAEKVENLKQSGKLIC